MPRILIIGKGSFIGSNFIKHSKYFGVKEVDIINQKPENIDFSGFDVVIHLAAIVHQKKSIPKDEYFRVNTLLPIAIAKLAKSKGVKQFIFLSSSKVYGRYDENQLPWNEQTECKPTDFYGESKLKAEQELLILADDTFRISIIRTPMVYGEGVKANMLQLIKLVDLFPILPFKGVQNKRSITYTENLVAYMDRIIEHEKSGLFIAMDAESPSIEFLVVSIQKSLGQKRLIFNPGQFLMKLISIFLPGYYERLYSSSVLDNTETRRILNFTPAVSSSEGIDRTVRYYLKTKK